MEIIVALITTTVVIGSYYTHKVISIELRHRRAKRIMAELELQLR